MDGALNKHSFIMIFDEWTILKIPKGQGAGLPPGPKFDALWNI
jgi:hypothetical protein